LRLLSERFGVQDDGKTPNLPPIDAKLMFWNMMRMSRRPDPWVFPALLKLKASGKFVIAALSNTIDFPVGVKDEGGELFSSQAVSEKGETVGDIRSYFDAFVSSAHTGMRKPERRIYDLALQECRRVAREKGIANDVQMGDILFLDDIGGNLKAAKQFGMRTIKVNLGRTNEAVRELEQAVEMTLIDKDAGSSRL
jgi:FMN phosphatase YigB (HAD superfamily)